MAEVLIFGSSRANHHYVPNVFEEGLKMSYYNTGRDGNSILYNYAVLKSILRRYTPEIIILDIRPHDFYFNSKGYERLSSLLPYYLNHQEIRSILNLRSPYERIELLSSIYPFNSSIITIGIGNLSINQQRKYDNKGYIPLDGKMKETDLIAFQDPAGTIDTNLLLALDSISEQCFRNNIKLFLCNSPFYFETTETKIDTLVRSIVGKYNFKYFDFSNEPDFMCRPDLFRDKSHLNNDGARCYSSMVLDSISLYCGIQSQAR
jgi:hypothetical protein